MPKDEISKLILSLLFTRPGLPTRQAAVDEQLIYAVGAIYLNYQKAELIDHHIVDWSLESFGLPLISNRFKEVLPPH